MSSLAFFFFLPEREKSGACGYHTANQRERWLEIIHLIFSFVGSLYATFMLFGLLEISRIQRLCCLSLFD